MSDICRTLLRKKHLLSLLLGAKMNAHTSEEGLTRNILGFETGNDDKDANVPMKVEIRDPERMSECDLYPDKLLPS